MKKEILQAMQKDILENAFDKRELEPHEVAILLGVQVGVIMDMSIVYGSVINDRIWADGNDDFHQYFGAYNEGELMYRVYQVVDKLCEERGIPYTEIVDGEMASIVDFCIEEMVNMKKE